jgi:phosphomannomutase / phosphoglucomutase
MAKKITVGDIAKRVEAGVQAPRSDFDPRKSLFALGIGLGLAFAAICAWQTWAAFRASLSAASAEQLANELSVDLGKEVADARKQLERATQSTEVFQQVTMVEGFDAASARARVLKLIPECVDADVIRGADVEIALGGRFAEFGFAKTDVLLEAQQEGNKVPAQLHVDKDKNYNLVLASPVTRGESTFGYVLAKFPAKNTIAKLTEFSGAGTIALQQQGLRDPVTMLSAGNGPTEGGQAKVPGSKLIFAWGIADPFAPLPFTGWVSTLMMMFLGLGLAGGLAFARSRPNLFADMAAKVIKPAENTESVADARPTTQRADKQLADQTAAKLASVKAAEALPPPRPDTDIAPSRAMPKVEVSRSIFRAYDIRGVVGSTLNEGVADLLGRALGSEVVERGLTEMVVARDGRLSGPALSAALIRGILSTGCNVIDLGAVPTPVLYFATYQLKTGCGVIVTGSHNPPDYNGFKMMIGGETLAEQAIQTLYSRIDLRRFAEGSGQLQAMDVTEDYVDIISGDIQLETPLRVVVDAGNGIAGAIAPMLLQAIGCEVEQLHCEVDGTFPNHHPDPSDPKNLKDLQIAVKQMNADIGVAFDGDGDRLGVITRSGKIIYPDRLLILFARDVLSRVPGASIIYDVKCTGALGPAIRGAGGVPVMYKTGHSLIKGKMKELDAALAGEMSGHFFFKERWFGFDDGLYAACRLLEILAASGLDADDLFDDIPDAVSTPELKIEMQEGEHYRFIERFVKTAKFPEARLTTIDGIRADFDDGWGLVRCSNTTPCLVLRFEGSSEAALIKVKERFREQLLALDKSLKLPF